MTENNLSLDRRAALKAAGWGAAAAGPIVASAAIPAFAASMDPRILQGWVLNTTDPQGSRYYDLDVNSAPPGWTVGPDGNPFGLYLINVQPGDMFANAWLRYSIIGNSHSRMLVNPRSGHSGLWGNPVDEGYSTKRDGNRYRSFKFNYATGAIKAADVDSNGRLFLGQFHVEFDFRQNDTSFLRNNVTYYTERSVDIKRAGSSTWETLPLIRRNGTLGDDNLDEASPRMRGGAALSLGTPVLAS